MAINFEPDNVRDCAAALAEFLRDNEPRWADHEMMLACIIIGANIGGFHVRKGCCEHDKVLKTISMQMFITFTQALGAPREGEVH